MRLIFIWMMIVGFLGIGLCDLRIKDYKLAFAGLLLALVQWLIFGKG